MASRRSYGSYNDGCAAAHALDLIGDRWTMIVVRELLLGPKRFSDIQRDVVGIGPAVLTQRLHDLESHGVVLRRRLPPPGRVEVYELSDWGYGLESVNTALSLWAVASPELPLDADMSPDTVVLAMRAHARAVGDGPEHTVGLCLWDSRQQEKTGSGGAEPVYYRARIGAGTTMIVRSTAAESSDAQVSASTRDWKTCLIGGVPLEQLPGVSVSGSPDAVRRLVEATSIAPATHRVEAPAGRED
ncbi:winged helix-turn-helix transcriptional regulator [Zhihengliuella salsuginis]|uniref:HTH hxlR-type domain-containing protein n=1 Tax=Zhihengliuella salsuginis TaxID=578222 RepID=A0ABQ3GAM8_9MICC|nr:helix-turn-helix domain-containing protein [Zhihengliuella salsuginis]GHC99851.1 hypothetical protein GCM10008096_02450 [Zhihengliuella salsuginis]